MPNLAAVELRQAVVAPARIQPQVDRYAVLKQFNEAATVGASAEFALLYEPAPRARWKPRSVIGRYPYPLTILASVAQRPTAPTALGATPVSETQINLSWGASSTTAPFVITQYNIYRDGVSIGATSALSYSDTGLTSWQAYDYYVTAQDNQPFESSPSNEASAQALDLTAPTVPTGLTASEGTGFVRLSWTASTDTASGVGSYRIYRNGVLVDTTAATTYDAASSVVATWSVRSVDNAGNLSDGEATISAGPAGPAVVHARFVSNADVARFFVRTG